jgi:hypothetical protein
VNRERSAMMRASASSDQVCWCARGASIDVAPAAMTLARATVIEVASSLRAENCARDQVRAGTPLVGRGRPLVGRSERRGPRFLG